MKKNITKLLLVFGLILMLTGCIPFEFNTDKPYGSPNEYEDQRINMIADVERAVIIVHTENGHGSGIIYRKENIEGNVPYRYYVITNHHVIENGGEMTIRYGQDGPQIPVRSYASNPLYDIAVLRVETEEELHFHPIPPIESNTLVEIKKGQDVYAIGTPQEYKKYNYVTQGIVSLTTFPYNGVEDLAIMHDAEVNPGNSGGPLFNLRGEVIGINVAKVAEVQSKDGSIAAEGLNYAININKAAEVIRAFKDSDFKVIERVPRLGVTVRNMSDHRNLDINPEYDPSLYPEDVEGVVIIDFDYTRNGHKVLQKNDVIIGMNGNEVKSLEDIQRELKDAKMGDAHVIKVLRKSGDTFIEVTVTVILS